MGFCIAIATVQGNKHQKVTVKIIDRKPTIEISGVPAFNLNAAGLVIENKPPKPPKLGIGIMGVMAVRFSLGRF